MGRIKPRWIEGLQKMELRRRRGMRWKWKIRGVSHEVTEASQKARREKQDRIDKEYAIAQKTYLRSKP